MKNLKIGLGQINSIIGDFEGNFKIISEYIKKAIESEVEIMVFPELTISGYPPQDLIYRENFVQKNREYLNRIAGQIPNNIIVIIGFIDEKNGKLFNSAAVLHDKTIVDVRYKTLLPNYDVFDEKRYFTPAPEIRPIPVKFNNREFNLGLQICEDLWDGDSDIKITDQLVEKGADIIVNLSASPFEKEKRNVRNQLVFDQVKKHRKPFILVNYAGAQDEIIFDGNSIACDGNGNVVCVGDEFKDSFYIGELNTENPKSLNITKIPVEESIFNALVLGVRDYFAKTGFTKAVLGLSGGIDSALVAAVAAKALGAENLTCIAMPSKYTSDMSNNDAKKLAENLGTNFEVIAIEELALTFQKNLDSIFGNRESDITEENIQSRIRGNLLMAVANKFGSLVLNTGNKTELALGYCTMYGDMAGAVGVIADLNKTEVYAVSKYINTKADKDLIPQRIIDRPPSAELKSEQIDPFDYDIVSPIVDLIINDGTSKESLLKIGYPKDVIDDCMRRIRINEYKRKQAPPALKVSKKAFGIGRRYPIVNKY